MVFSKGVAKHCSFQVKNTDERRKELESMLSQLNQVRSEDVALNREIAVAQRQVDSVPSQIEISQYQRRIMELFNQSSCLDLV